MSDSVLGAARRVRSELGLSPAQVRVVIAAARGVADDWLAASTGTRIRRGSMPDRTEVVRLLRRPVRVALIRGDFDLLEVIAVIHSTSVDDLAVAVFNVATARVIRDRSCGPPTRTCSLAQALRSPRPKATRQIGSASVRAGALSVPTGPVGSASSAQPRRL